MSKPNQQRVGEVVEAATERFIVHCYRLYDSPSLGSLVRAGDDSPIYGVVSGITTTGLDPGRRPIARGEAAEAEEDVYRANPQLERLLRTDFQATVVGHGRNGSIRYYLPPLPPHIHAFVCLCSPQEVAQFTRELAFLPLLIQPQAGVGDEVLAACLRWAAAANPDPGAFLGRAGKELARLLSRDLQRLASILKRLT